MKRIAALALALAACSGAENDQPGNNAILAGDTEAPAAPNEAAPIPISGYENSPPAEPPPAPPSASDSQKSPEAAAAVLRQYFDLIEQRKFVAAHRLWSSSSADDDLSDGAFAASFDKYRSYHAVVGAAGRMEGAAGSSYIDFPVTVTGELKSGGPFRLEGPVTLRRVNDVPGATPEQLQWRIMRSSLKPRPPRTAYRFVGKWASNKANCRLKAWTFTADGVTTAGPDCRFTNVAEAPGGYDLAARCTPGGAEAVKIRFAESARAMLVESRALGDVGLIRCG